MGSDKYTKLLALGVDDIVAIDTEFCTRRGSPVIPVCLCAKSLLTGHEWRHWYEPGSALTLSIGVHTLYVTFAAPAEWSCFLALDQPLPISVVDLFAERMRETNGYPDGTGKRRYPGLLSSLEAYGIAAMTAVEKKEMRDLVMRGAPYSAIERESILEYCMEDVANTIKLFDAMLPSLSRNWPNDFGQALARGAYTRSVAHVEFAGIPIDTVTADRLKNNWPATMAQLAMALEADHNYGCYIIAGEKVIFSMKGFESLVRRLGLADQWPRTRPTDAHPGGQFIMADGMGSSGRVFKAMAELRPELEDLRQMRKTFSAMKTFDLPAGPDGRCRTDVSPWHTITGRNQPRKGFVFALPKWVRFLIKPAPGRALLYSDLVSAEFGIAAALSGDKNMIATYNTGEDIYLAIAKLAGAVSAGATKESNPNERALYKTAMLAVQYGMSAWGLAKRLGISDFEARELLNDLQRMYKTYFSWIEWVKIDAQIDHRISAPMGWEMHVDADTKENALLNYPMQTACGEILHLATTQMIDNGIQLDAMVHDATLTEGATANVERDKKIVGECWTRASEVVLGGFALRSDCKVTIYPNRYFDKDGEAMWKRLHEMKAA
jgi:DNA polymerase I